MRPFSLGRLCARLLILSLLVLPSMAKADSPATGNPLVIGEVNWAGSSLSTADEWLELWNLGDLPIELNGYHLAGAGTRDICFGAADRIDGRGVFLIANYAADEEKSALNVVPRMVTTTVSLSNDKLAIQLFDPGGQMIDQAGDGQAPPAGATGEQKKSMIRSGATWETAAASSGFDPGTNELGTPGWCDGCFMVATDTGRELNVTSTTATEEPSESDSTATSTAVTDEAAATSTDIIFEDASSTTTDLNISDSTSTTEIVTSGQDMVDATESTSTSVTTTTEIQPSSLPPPPAPPPAGGVIPPPTQTPSASTVTTAKPAVTKKITTTKKIVAKQPTTKTVNTKTAKTEQKVAPSTKPIEQKVASKAKVITVKPVAAVKKPATAKKTTPALRADITMLNDRETGTRLSVTGIVASLPNLISQNQFVIQTEDGRGLLVRSNSRQKQPEFGSLVSLTGKLELYDWGPSLRMLTADRWVLLKKQVTVRPRDVDLIAPDQEDAWSLAQATGTVRDVKNSIVDAYNDDGNFKIRIRPTIGYRAARLKPGDVINVQGLLDTRAETMVFYPRQAGEIVLLQHAAEAKAAAAAGQSQVPPWAPFGSAGATLVAAQGVKRLRKYREQKRLQTLLTQASKNE